MIFLPNYQTTYHNDSDYYKIPPLICSLEMHPDYTSPSCLEMVFKFLIESGFSRLGTLSGPR